MPLPARHIRVTGCPGGRPTGCIPEHAQAPVQAGGTVAHQNGARQRNGQPGSAAARPPQGHLAPLLHPRGDGDTPEASQGGGRGGSQWQPKDFPALWLSGEKFSQGYRDQRRGRQQPREQPGRAGQAHRDLGPAPCLSASPISSDFWASSERFPYHLRTPQAFSSYSFTRGLIRSRVCPRHMAVHMHTQLWSETSTPAAPAWLQLKFPGNGG